MNAVRSAPTANGFTSGSHEGCDGHTLEIHAEVFHYCVARREEEMIAMKVLRCRDTGIDCGWEGRAETEKELLEKAGRHAADVHHQTTFSDEEIAAVKAAIREE